MPPLENPKHELFAQEVAKGISQREAYETAGFKPSDAHASRLASDGKVVARVAELQEQSAKRAEITAIFTLADAARQYDEDRALAHKMGQAGAAVSASTAKAKLFGLVVDKTELNDKRAERMGDDELARIAAGSGAGASAPKGTTH